MLLNAYRELGKMVMKKTTFVLASADVGGGIRVVRIASYFMYFTFQVSMGVMFRLEIANFDSQALTTFVVVTQAVLEVVMRFTAEEREKYLGNLLDRSLRCCTRTSKKRHGSGRRLSLVVEAGDKSGAAIAPAPTAATSGPGPREFLQTASPAPGAKTMALREERLADEAERSTIIKNFNAVCILADMVAEYAGKFFRSRWPVAPSVVSFLTNHATRAGILIGALNLWQGMQNPLVLPYRPLRMQPEIFFGKEDVMSLLSITAQQLGAEVLTDTFCLMFERYRGYDGLKVWHSLPKTAMLPYVVVVFAFGSIAGTYRSLLSDNFTACNHQNFCLCMGDGLLVGGVRELKSLIIYANSSGYPPLAGNATGAA